MAEHEQGLQGITIKSFSKENPPTADQFVQTASIYAQVFAGYPWFEVNRCSNCESYYGQDSSPGQDCIKCGNGTIGPAYPIDKQVATMREMLGRPGAVMFFAELGHKTIGFAWTHIRDTEDYLKRFEHLPPEIRSKIRPLLSQKESLYSLAEIGVDESYLGRGLGKELFRLQVDAGSKYGLTQMAWTRHDTVITPICLKNGFTQIFGREVVLVDGRTTLTGDDIIGRNPADPERVLFIKT